MRKWALLTIQTALFTTFFGIEAVNAQFRVVTQPERVEQAQVVNLYLTLEGSDPAAGLYVTLPEDWTIQEVARISQDGRTTYISFRPGTKKDPRTLIMSESLFRPEDHLLLQISTSARSGTSSVTTTPIYLQGGLTTSREELRTKTVMEVERSVINSSNLVASFSGLPQDAPLLALSNKQVLQADAPYTVAFWMKTSGLNEVILSTWTGSEEDDYVMEMVVSPSGYLEFFRGEGGRHFSMRSSLPIADGNWHFASVTNSPESGWMHLRVDDIDVDSLFRSSSLSSQNAQKMRLGYRVQSQEPVADIDGYSGQMDEFRLLGRSLAGEELEEEMRVQARRASDLETILGFNERVSRPETGNLTIEPSDLSFRKGPTQLQVQAESPGTRITFQSEDEDVDEFVVERSVDGQVYDDIAHVEGTESTGTTNLLEYMDYTSGPGVVYYRIIAHYEDGTSQASPSLKAGFGDDPLDHSAVLVGNFPNPFNPTTTITFDVQETQYVRISVWDLSGQMIRTLVDGTHSPGEYDVQFDAGSLPSGTYFIRMESVAGIQTHQMMLMK